MTTQTTILTPCQRVALTVDTATLRHTITALESDLLAAMSAGVRGTQAHLGMIEMMEAFSHELRVRSL